MRIARPSRPEVPFKRKRGPPPQATKLLTYSLAAGIVFMVLLGIVFLPRMFPNQPPVAIIQLGLRPGAGTEFEVAAVTMALGVEKFRAVFTRDGSVLATLGPPLQGGNATLRFADVNGNGLLDPGDYFALSPPPTGCFRFEIFQVDVDRRVALETWGGCA